jgi:hypothetical protein
MERERLTAIGDPPFYVCTLDKSDFFNLGWQIRLKNERHVTRIIRGSHGQTLDDFYAESAAALQFPYYFGENWDAYNDCIRDLAWITADAYVIMFDDGDLLLDQEDLRMFEILIRLHTRATTDWLTPNSYAGQVREPVPFHTLFRCDKPQLPFLLDRLERAGAAFEVLDLSV